MEFNKLATIESIETTIANLAKNNIEGLVVETKSAALEKVKELIPADSPVMNGSSTTLEEIGYVDYLKSGEHGWNNLHTAIVAEVDPQKQASLRQAAIHADYYLGSVHGLSETGEFIVASNTGSQLPHIVFTTKNLIFVVGAQKIVPTLSAAMERLESYVLPLENKRIQALYHMDSQISKIVIFKKENPFLGRKVRVIIVKESLGY